MSPGVLSPRFCALLVGCCDESRCTQPSVLREHGHVPLSEDEQRVLDEIERQLQIGDARSAEPRARRVVDQQVPVRGPSLTMALVFAIVGGLTTVIVGVLIGGLLGIGAALVGFGAIVAAGVKLLRSTRESLTAQIHEIASRYQGPVR
jgi:hypothetical protein